LHFSTWNVAGVAEGELDCFISQIGDNYTWDVLLLQEAFVRTEGIVIDGGHQVYTSTELERGIAMPSNHCS
jgi:exonuclease III